MTAHEVLKLIQHSPNGAVVCAPSFLTFLDHPGLLIQAYQSAGEKQIGLHFIRENQRISHAKDSARQTIMMWAGFLSLAGKEMDSYLDWMKHPHQEEPVQCVSICTENNCDAKGYATPDGFVVIAGSRISPKCTPKCPENALKLRAKYRSLIDDDFRLQESIRFSDIETATVFVRGRCCTTDASWKGLIDQIDMKRVGNIINASLEDAVTHE